MDSIGKIERRRQAILEEIGAMRSMERASLNEQMLPVKQKWRKEPVLRGPYYVLARWKNGKTHSRRVPSDELEQVKRDVANYQRLLALSKEYAELTEQLGKLEREAAASEEAVRKGLKARSSRARK